MGSSCYTRGNDEVLTVIRNYIDGNNLSEKVDFRGHLCEGHCNKGPNISIGAHDYHEVDNQKLNDILEDIQQSTKTQVEEK